MPGSLKIGQFHNVKWHQNEESQQIVTEIQSVLKVVRIYQHPNFSQFLPCVLKKEG